MSYIDVPAPTKEELEEIKEFYPEGCDHFYNGRSGTPTVPAVILFRKYETSKEVCQGCLIECPVRQSPHSFQRK